MDAAELETYQVQLSQVKEALQDDPDNAGLKSLATELTELIELTQSALQQQQQASSSKAESSKKASVTHEIKSWAAGDDCLAKYSSDGNWYPARITSVGGAEQNRVYSVMFKGYHTTELLKASELKPLPPSSQHTTSSLGGAGSKRKAASKEEEEDIERRKKKNAKKLEVREVKAKEQKAKQDSWKKFTTKSTKKGIEIAGVTGRSIFKTPDNPLGKGTRIVRMP